MAAVLIGVGYIVETARESMLGVPLPARRNTYDYAVAGGGFFVDLLNRLWANWEISVWGLLAFIVFVGSVALLRRPVHLSHYTRVICLAAVVVLFSWKSLRFDLPYIQMRDLLTKSPTESDGAKASPLQFGRFSLDISHRGVWEQYLCSHAGLTALERFPSCRKVAARSCDGAPIREIIEINPEEDPCITIEQEFVLNFFVTLLLTSAAVATLTAGGAFKEMPMLFLAGIVTTIISLASLPLIYGKVIRPVTFASGTVTVEVGPPSNIELVPVEALIVAADDKFVTLYDPLEHEFVEIARTQIRLITIRGTADLVDKHTEYLGKRGGQ